MVVVDDLIGAGRSGKRQTWQPGWSPSGAGRVMVSIPRTGKAEVSVDALVIAPVVVVRDERIDLSVEIAGQIIVLEQDAVLERLMPALDFPLRHRMIRRTTRMSHVLPLKPFGQVAGDVARPVVR